ncbi:MAG TPA: type II toxin-antitoxin system VapC family toxin [Blastocatellia bacterium]|nr:type II toxin-antitoxin system VapC family toxin [Blastocatellia bacterium]
MAAYFFDSSAVVKRYVNETGTLWVSGIAADGANKVYVVRLTLVEVVSAMTRKARGAEIAAAGAATAVAGFRRDFLNQYAKVDLTHELIERAADLAETHALRGYDAIQLSAALEVGSERATVGMSAITLISADAALNAAAAAEGLAVDDPNAHA